MTLTRKSEEGDWEGTIEILGHTYPFTISSAYEEHELEEIAAAAREFLQTSWRSIHDQLVSDLLPMHNEEWSDQDSPPVSAEQFLSTVGTPDVDVWEEEAIMLTFPDGGLFSGHYIQVFIDGPEMGRSVSVSIVG